MTATPTRVKVALPPGFKLAADAAISTPRSRSRLRPKRVYPVSKRTSRDASRAKSAEKHWAVALGRPAPALATKRSVERSR